MRGSATGNPGASAGKACAAGFSAPATSRRRRNCCARGRASAIPQLLAAIAALNERRSGRSDRSADFRCWPNGSPPAPTTATPIGWRGRPSPSLRRGISPLNADADAELPAEHVVGRRAAAAHTSPAARVRRGGGARPAAPRAGIAAETAPAWRGNSSRNAAGRSGAPAAGDRPADRLSELGRARIARLRPVPRAVGRGADRAGRARCVRGAVTGDGTAAHPALAARRPTRARRSSRRTAVRGAGSSDHHHPCGGRADDGRS